MALEEILVYRIATGDDTYPHSGSFTIETAGTITIDDSSRGGNDLFGDYTHTGGRDVRDQDVTQSTVSEISNDDLVDVRYKYTFTGSDGSSGTIYFVATNYQNDYGSLLVSDTPLDQNVTYTFGTFNTDGAVLYDDLYYCFAAETLIDTPKGMRQIETLQPGDLVHTIDSGAQPIRWIGRRWLPAAQLVLNPKLVPIRIKAGALAPSVPERDLVLSPQHRVLVRSVIAERMFGTKEVLLPARKLLDLPGVEQATDLAGVEYVHFLFDRHQLVRSEGAVTESLYTGPEALKAVGEEAREEIETLFPEITAPCFSARLARPEPPRRKQMARLIARHVQNKKSVQAMLH